MLDQATDAERARCRCRPRLVVGETERGQPDAVALLFEVGEQIGAFAFDCGNVSGHVSVSLLVDMISSRADRALKTGQRRDRFHHGSVASRRSGAS